MKIFVFAKPSSRTEFVEQVNPPMGQTANPYYTVAVKEPPVGGKANHAIIKALSEYFKVPLTGVRLISGHTSRQKMFDIAIKD